MPRIPGGAEQRVSDKQTRPERVDEDDPRFMRVSRASSRRASVPIPEPSPKWNIGAQSWFRSLKLSGQSDLFEASDWSTAVAAAQAYDIFLKTHNASIFAQFVKLSERLGCTVIDRKRSRIELVDGDAGDQDEDAADAAVLGWHNRLRVVDDS